jgi:multicomponent Na+:H+ antiporter subunit G
VNVAQVIVGILLAGCVLLCWLCALGVALMPTAYDKLHYIAPAGLLGGAAVLIAMLVHSGFTADTGKVLLIVLLLWLSNPVLTYATARAIITRESHPSETERGKRL